MDKMRPYGHLRKSRVVCHHIAKLKNSSTTCDADIWLELSKLATPRVAKISELAFIRGGKYLGIALRAIGVASSYLEKLSTLGLRGLGGTVASGVGLFLMHDSADAAEYGPREWEKDVSDIRSSTLELGEGLRLGLSRSWDEWRKDQITGKTYIQEFQSVQIYDESDIKLVTPWKPAQQFVIRGTEREYIDPFANRKKLSLPWDTPVNKPSGIQSCIDCHPKYSR